MRKLATIRRISELNPIPKADAIEVATVDGWKAVVKKGDFKVGDLAIYLEVDSWVPYELAPFLSKDKEPKEYNGVKGERLRTIKLRGQLSQGLLLPIDVAYDEDPPDYDHVFLEGDDVTELLGIQKWERPVPAQLAGLMKGSFPSFIPKTDQERCLSGNTLVETENGLITIKDLVDTKSTQKVLSYNHDTNQFEYKSIIGWSVMTRRDNWVKITLKSGKVLICTTNHKIWCNDISAYRDASTIEVGQKFITKTDKEAEFLINNSITTQKENNDTMPVMSERTQR